MFLVEKRQPSIRDRESAAGQIGGNPVAILDSNSAQCGHCGSQKISNCTGAPPDPTTTPLPSVLRGMSACAVPVPNITNHSAEIAHTRRQNRIIQPPCASEFA